ncbi:MAG: uracil-DNA glycosylase [Microthrixaceae bacterium]
MAERRSDDRAATPEQSPPGSAAFEQLRSTALGCTACRLCESRSQVVFGMGDPAADLMFVGEGPGAEEDRQGLPFVGRSGKLLDRLMAEEMGLTRETAYIANVVKCRPPENRDPKPDEIAACRPYLEQQIELIDPAVVVTLGNFASKLLLDTKTGITRIRGRAYRWGDRVLVPTLHPAAVLRGGGSAMSDVRADLVRAKAAASGGLIELTDASVVAS